MYRHRRHWIIKTDNNNNRSTALASLLQFGIFHRGFTIFLWSHWLWQLNCRTSWVWSHLTQGELPVPAALTSHPCADKALLSSAPPSSSSLTCNFPGERTSLLLRGPSACRGSSKNWDFKLFVLIYKGWKGEETSVTALSLLFRQRISLPRQAFWQGISPNPCSQQLRRSHSGSPQVPRPDCAAALSKKAPARALNEKKVARNSVLWLAHFEQWWKRREALYQSTQENSWSGASATRISH